MGTDGNVELPDVDPGIMWDGAVEELYRDHATMLDDASFVEVCLSLSSEQPHVIDIGCGFGRLLPFIREYAEKKAPIGNYVGVDCSDGMLTKARALYPDADFRKASIGSLTETVSEEFDVALLIRSISNIPRSKMTAALCDVRSCLRKNAVGLIFTDYGIGEHIVTHADSDGIPEGTKFGMYDWTEESLRPHLVEAGFIVEHIHQRCACHIALFIRAV